MIHPRASFTATHPLRRSAGIAFVVALHIAAIVAINNGLGFNGIIPKLRTAHIVPIFKPTESPPMPIPAANPNLSNVTRFVLQEPTLPTAVENATADNSANDANLPATSTEKSQRIEPVIVTARVNPAHPLTQPAYPVASRRNNEEGRVELMLYILANGKVGEARVAQSSGHTRLDESAMKEALRAWRFIPQQENGIAVASWQRFAITFKLES